jgi:hypothetical protein
VSMTSPQEPVLERIKSSLSHTFAFTLSNKGHALAVGCQCSIRIWESGEWQTRTAECRQRSANPLPRKQMVVALRRKRLGVLPSLH